MVPCCQFILVQHLPPASIISLTLLILTRLQSYFHFYAYAKNTRLVLCLTAHLLQISHFKS